MGNHVIRFELLSALLHTNLCCSGLTIFCRKLSDKICFHFPFQVVNDICIVVHFETEKMKYQINCEGWRSRFGKALSSELIIYSSSNRIII